MYTVNNTKKYVYMCPECKNSVSFNLEQTLKFSNPGVDDRFNLIGFIHIEGVDMNVMCPNCGVDMIQLDELIAPIVFKINRDEKLSNIIRTVMSCQGHYNTWFGMDNDACSLCTSGPWIDVEYDEDLYQNLVKLRDEFAKRDATYKLLELNIAVNPLYLGETPVEDNWKANMIRIACYDKTLVCDVRYNDENRIHRFPTVPDTAMIDRYHTHRNLVLNNFESFIDYVLSNYYS